MELDGLLDSTNATNTWFERTLASDCWSYAAPLGGGDVHTNNKDNDVFSSTQIHFHFGTAVLTQSWHQLRQIEFSRMYFLSFHGFSEQTNNAK